MDEYTVKITSQAEEHLQEITRYITHELKAPEAAFHLLNSLESSFASLKHFPKRASLVEYEPWHSNGVHFIPVKNFLGIVQK